eukprot:TRINITY_DN6031_c0_g1_i1.p1 TRINITY_DN6031_c0_g1~~TRINITY_DN6031_c0_g1_i1.p1  ORF type:complete len:457 (+),score=39.78 TRINITY_DN6031_c0_g1_i1:34-1404(+)
MARAHAAVLTTVIFCGILSGILLGLHAWRTSIRGHGSCHCTTGSEPDISAESDSQSQGQIGVRHRRRPAPKRVTREQLGHAEHTDEIQFQIFNRTSNATWPWKRTRSCDHLDKHRSVLRELAAGQIESVSQLELGGVNYKTHVKLRTGREAVFRFFRPTRFTAYHIPLHACTNWASEVFAFHVNAVLGLDQVPPVSVRRMPNELLCNATLSRSCALDTKRQCENHRNRCLGRNQVSNNYHFGTEVTEAPEPVVDNYVQGSLQVFWPDVQRLKKKIQISAYSFETKPAPWCLQSQTSEMPPADLAIDWLAASETLLFSYLTNNWDRLYAGGNDLFVRKGTENDLRFVWLDNGNAFSSYGTDPLNGGKTLKMLCSACKFAKHIIDKLREAPLGELVKYSVERCTEPLTFFPLMTERQMQRFYDGMTKRQEFVLEAVDRCVAQFGEKAVLSLRRQSQGL